MTGVLPTGWRGIPIDRVVAVVASLASGLEQVGSGYLVGGRLVLTAEHCTCDKNTGQPARSLRVVRASDGEQVAASIRAASPEDDVAVLDVVESLGPEDMPALLFGRVDRTHSGELRDCAAIGYPLWQLDPSDRQRGTAELNGTIRSTEDADVRYLVLRDRLLSDVAAPPTVTSAEGSDPSSTWGGLSGALVFRAGIALGVVVQHHPRKGASAVRLVPFDRIATSDDERTQALAIALGLPSADRMRLVGAAEPESPLEELADWLDDEDPPRIEDLDPYRLGATRSDYGDRGSYGERDLYVPRSIDGDLGNALRPGALVLLVGPSKAGKTRTAFEALRSHWGQARLVVPVVGALERLSGHPRLRDTTDPLVIWLDDLHGFVTGAEPLTPSLLARLTSRPGPTVVVATLRSEERDRLRGDAGELSRDTRSLLDAAAPTTIELASTVLDSDEQEAARATYPNEDLSVGLAERLANAPILLDAYKDAAAAENPLRHVLVRTAIDWARVGGPQPIPEPDLLDLTRSALWEEHTELDPDEKQTAEALEWARKPFKGSGGVALVSTHPLPEHVRGYWPFSYLVAADDGQSGTRRSIPAAVWQQVTERAAPQDCLAIGVNAYYRGNRSAAIRASQKAAEAGHSEAMFNLGVLLQELDPPELEAARAWYEKAIEAGHTAAMHNLGVLLQRLDPPDLKVARAWYEKAAEAGDTDAMTNLGALLAGLDPPELEAARAWWEKAAAAGDTDAMTNLGLLLQMLDPPERDAARAWYEKAAEGGDADAMFALGPLLAGLDPPELDAARAWWEKAAEAGHTDAMVNLGELAELDPPDLDAARAWYEKAAAAGHTGAMYDLVLLLQKLDPPDLEAARAWYEKAAEASLWAP